MPNQRGLLFLQKKHAQGGKKVSKWGAGEGKERLTNLEVTARERPPHPERKAEENWYDATKKGIRGLKREGNSGLVQPLW